MAKLDYRELLIGDALFTIDERVLTPRGRYTWRVTLAGFTWTMKQSRALITYARFQTAYREAWFTHRLRFGGVEGRFVNNWPKLSAEEWCAIVNEALRPIGEAA